MLVTIIILTIFIIILGIAIRNLLIKVEKYEDVTVDQTKYLQNISDLIRDSQKHLKSMDERGILQADDEIGYFFEQMKKVQEELDKYMLPENYGKKEE
jgi:CHASE3 domain sensor protein